MILAQIGAALLAGMTDRRAILSLPAGAATSDLLARECGKLRILAHALWTDGAAPDGEIPIVLGADDRDERPRQATIWPGAGRLHPCRTRRIDTLYNTTDIGLILLADPGSAEAALQGAAATLTTHRPAVLLDLRAAADPQALRHSISALLPDYRWTEPSRAILCATPPGMDTMHRIYPPPPAPMRTPFDNHLVAFGLHLAEPGAPLGGRWTGARLAPWFTLPRPTPGRWKLRLEIADWGNAEAGFSARIGNALLPPRLVPDWAEYGPIAISDDGPVLRVSLYPPRPIADQVRWPRKIGIRIARATLVPA